MESQGQESLCSNSWIFLANEKQKKKFEILLCYEAPVQGGNVRALPSMTCEIAWLLVNEVKKEFPIYYCLLESNLKQELFPSY